MRKLILVILLLIILPNAFASVSIATLKNNIVLGTNQFASYQINIKNNYNHTERFDLYVKDFSWSVWSDPLSDYLGGGISIGPGKNYTVHLYLKPPVNIRLGSYSLPLVISAEQEKTRETKLLMVNVISGKPTLREYAIAVVASLDFPASIDPRKNYTLKIAVENLFPRNISNMRVEVKSKLINKELPLSLGPLESAKIQLKVHTDPFIEPATDTLYVKFIVNDKLIKELKQSYHIIGYSKIEKANESLQKKFLARTIKLEYYNRGNKENSQTIYYPAGWFKRIFTTSQPPYYVVSKNGESFIAWDLTLKPQEHKEIVITESYRSPFVVLLIIAFLIGLYYLMRSPLVVDKSIKLVEIKDGAISELKVLIHLKNRTGSHLKDIRIADKIPGLISIEKQFEIGTIEPTKIIKDSKGNTLIRWEIDELEPYEERIISYKVRARLRVIGDFTLPSALVKFRTSSGAQLKARSGLGRINQ